MFSNRKSYHVLTELGDMEHTARLQMPFIDFRMKRLTKPEVKITNTYEFTADLLITWSRVSLGRNWLRLKTMSHRAKIAKYFMNGPALQFNGDKVNE